MRRPVVILLAALALVATWSVAAGSSDVAAVLEHAVPTAAQPPAHGPARPLAAPPPSAPQALLAAPVPGPGLVAAGAHARAERRAARRAVALRAAARAGADVLVDKRRGLRPAYRPRDLVPARVAFLPGASEETRLMRRRPARALVGLFRAARRDGAPLAGVSAFRSYGSQRALFASYAQSRGVRDASHVSARAGHSEHQTGLAIDIAGADGRCAASRCFARTRAARWLERHAHEHGFVVRYPRGRQAVTGYAHEPWHLRWVGRPLAAEAHASGLTLDELLR